MIRILCLLLFTLPAFAQSFTLDALMQTLAQVREVQGRFQETKELALLDQPLTSHGTLHYRAPDYLQKQTLSPQPETFELRGDVLTLNQSGHAQRRLSLDDHPVLRAFVESFRATLAGDTATLHRYYWAELSGGWDGWTLRLTPKDFAMTDYVSHVLIHGVQDHITAVETVETGGDRSRMTISRHD